MSGSFFRAFRCCKGDTDTIQTGAEGIPTNNVRLFSYNLLRSATGNFHPTSRIGGGGYGVVYKGVFKDGTQVAIKCLSAESKQGTNEFLTEINMISNIRHPNLVEFIGCCVEGNHRILVYEYLENNSLASALLGSKSKHVALDWLTRAKICLGTASGLVFLHEEAEPHVVHRDIKASNILLSRNFDPKIGDFGLAKLFPDNVTHLSTRVAGTVGYLAPEYALLGQLTKKADVYSFGVLMLEIISGRSSSKSAFGEELMVLVEWTWKLREEKRLLEIVDPELRAYPEGEVLRFIKVALFCTQGSAHQRPTMRQVVEMLSKEVHLNESALTEPRIYRGHSSKQLGGASTEESSSSQAEKGKQPVNKIPSWMEHATTEGLGGGLVERSKHLLTRPVNCPNIVQELRQNLSQVKTTMEQEIHACPRHKRYINRPSKQLVQSQAAATTLGVAAVAALGGAMLELPAAGVVLASFLGSDDGGGLGFIWGGGLCLSFRSI